MTWSHFIRFACSLTQSFCYPHMLSIRSCCCGWFLWRIYQCRWQLTILEKIHSLLLIWGQIWRFGCIFRWELCVSPIFSRVVMMLSAVICCALRGDGSKFKVDLFVRVDNLLCSAFYDIFLLRFIWEVIAYNISWVLTSTVIETIELTIWMQFWVCWHLPINYFICKIFLSFDCRLLRLLSNRGTYLFICGEKLILWWLRLRISNYPFFGNNIILGYSLDTC